MTLIKYYTVEDLQHKIEYEGLGYFILYYLDTDLIECESFRKSVQQFKLAHEDIIQALENAGVDLNDGF